MSWSGEAEADVAWRVLERLKIRKRALACDRPAQRDIMMRCSSVRFVHAAMIQQAEF
jgi:hypothetical protein